MNNGESIDAALKNIPRLYKLGSAVNVERLIVSNAGPAMNTEIPKLSGK